MKYIENWSLNELAYQCVIARLDIEKYSKNQEYKNKCRQYAENGIAGFCIFGGDLNETKAIIDELQMFAEIPLIFTSDFENGLRMRLSEGTEFPHSMALGKINNTNYTKDIASAIAKECKALGVHWVFAPVCDINSNPKNPIINIRSFGETKEIVLKHSNAYINGLQSNNIAACCKHFPGHGDTAIDSHIQLPFINKNLSELEENEFVPFIEGIASGVKSVMLGHLTFNEIQYNKIPTSLNSNLINNLLREELKYDGIIITDALEMRAITNYIEPDLAALEALKAGCNIALMPVNVDESINVISAELENNAELKEHLKASVKKLIDLKRWCKLMPQYAVLENRPEIFLEHPKLALKVATEAITKHGDKSILPIDGKTNFGAFAIINTEDEFNSAYNFFKMTAQALENDCDFGFIDLNISNGQILELQNGIQDAELIVFAVFSKPRAEQLMLSDSKKMNDIFNSIAKDKKKLIILFGNPYLQEFLEYDLCLLTYSDSYPSQAAAVVVLSGREEAALKSD